MVSHPPSVDALASALDVEGLPRTVLVEVARHAIERSRSSGDDPAVLALADAQRLAALRPRRVINATGVLLHTNLGRAPLAPEAAESARDVAVEAAPLEFDISTGTRGGRGAYVSALLTSLTGAEAALVVNNNAAALLLSLAALGTGREVIVSRGELIEIGGSFRLPELMEASGARLREIGTTNRTRLKDYRRAIDDTTAALLKVHPSNYRIEGFTEDVGYGELAELAQSRDLPFIADVGSGLLDARVPWIDGSPPAWLADEPAVRQTVATGAAVVLFSGDKLLGGPQAGIAVGSSAAIDAMRSHPIARAARIDGIGLAALAGTLELYASGRGSEIPFWRMATSDAKTLAERCRRIMDDAGVDASIIDDRSLPGAGTVPGVGIPGPVLLIEGASESAWRRLLQEAVPIVARRDDRGLIVDVRSFAAADDDIVASGLASACR